MNLTDASKKPWNASDQPTLEHIQCGSLQRIAAAAELMAKRHTELIEQRDYFQRIATERAEVIADRDRTISALRGVITKMKKGQQHAAA